MPLSRATNADIERLLAGQIADHSESTWHVTDLDVAQVRVSCLGTGLTWTLTGPVPVTLNEDGTARFHPAYELLQHRRH